MVSKNLSVCLSVCRQQNLTSIISELAKQACFCPKTEGPDCQANGVYCTVLRKIVKKTCHSVMNNPQFNIFKTKLLQCNDIIPNCSQTLFCCKITLKSIILYIPNKYKNSIAKGFPFTMGIQITDNCVVNQKVKVCPIIE